MPRRTDLKKILVIGSGPIVIGQAAEFDYAGTQACLALKEEGYEVLLINSNPATIMTDSEIADKVYMEPLTIEFVAKILRKERPYAVIPGLGGQTGLNLVMELSKAGVLKECNCEVLGTSLEAISEAEDREKFKDLCVRIGEPVLTSYVLEDEADILHYAKEIGYPVVLRPAYTLGGTGGGFGSDEASVLKIAKNALKLSPTKQVLIEKSIKGYKEIEYEIMRDKNDTAISICNMENIDPVGVHTGDSAVVAPSLTLTNKEYQMLRTSALNIVRELKIEGGCNAQFALDPVSKQYYVIEVNPRVSRSSALASKATGYPIAYVSTKIALGYDLHEIRLKNTLACFEPALDYVVTKLARFPFDKFTGANRELSTQMKATGEVMGVGRTYEESLLKALRSLDNGHSYFTKLTRETKDLYYELEKNTDEKFYLIGELFRRGETLEKIYNITKISLYFLRGIQRIIDLEKELETKELSKGVLGKYKKYGFSDEVLASIKGVEEEKIRALRKEYNLTPVYKMIDSCAGEFGAYIPYFYSTYAKENESIVTSKKKIVVIGSGSIRIGQGIEFDYSTVHAIKTIQRNGYEAIVINCNPETVSTDYQISDKLYFEPLTYEDVMNVIDHEKPAGVVVQLGGQTPISLASELSRAGVKILGTSPESIDRAEDREKFEEFLTINQIKRPQGETITSISEGLAATKRIGFPLLVRPSFVLGGRAMEILRSDRELENYLKTAVEVNTKHPVLLDKYISGTEVEVDAICDGKEIFIPGIMEHIEKTGVHSGDSISVYPTYSISEKVLEKIRAITKQIGLNLEIKGLYNIQYIVTPENEVYIIEVNPRASRTVPFISKVTKHNLSVYATEIMLGKSIEELGIKERASKKSTNKSNDKLSEKSSDKEKMCYVKVPTFSFSKISGLDTYLSPEMKSTGEAIGYDKTLNKALYKGLIASGMKLRDYGTILFTVSDLNKEEGLSYARRFFEMGFNIVTTKNTGLYFKKYGVKCKILKKLSEGSSEIIDWINEGTIKYIVNITDDNSKKTASDGYKMRVVAASQNITTFTSFDTLDQIINILEERTLYVNEV